MPGDAIIDSLVKFRSKNDLLLIWQQITDSLLAGATDDVVITSGSLEGANATGVRIPIAERELWISRIQRAIATIDGDSADGPGLKLDFSTRQVRT